MATPVTLKRMEEAKEKAKQRKAYYDRSAVNPLTYGYAARNNNYQSRNVDFTSSTPRGTGRQYTSFEANGTKRAERRVYAPRKPVELAVQAVAEAPLGMGTDDYILDAKTLVCFSGKDHFLSNLSPSTLLIDGLEYQSVEHYYQACKLYSLAGSEYALQLRDILEPIRVKAAAKRILSKLRVPKEKIEEWKATQGFIMLNHAMVHKFLQNLELRKQLLDTDDAILVHAYDRETFYACGMDKETVEKWATDNQGKIIKIPSEFTFENVKYFPLIGNGKNIVGAMCMKIRKMITELERDKEEVTLDKFLPSIMSYLKISDSTTTTTSANGAAAAKAENGGEAAAKQ